MKLIISVSKIHNPVDDPANDGRIRGPADSHKVLRHFKNYSKQKFLIRIYKKEHERTIDYLAETRIVTDDIKDTTKINKELTTYLKHNKWTNTGTSGDGAAIWAHPKLQYLTVRVSPMYLSKDGSAFNVTVVGREDHVYRKQQKKDKPKYEHNKVYDEFINRFNSDRTGLHRTGIRRK